MIDVGITIDLWRNDSLKSESDKVVGCTINLGGLSVKVFLPEDEFLKLLHFGIPISKGKNRIKDLDHLFEVIEKSGNVGSVIQ